MLGSFSRAPRFSCSKLLGTPSFHMPSIHSHSALFSATNHQRLSPLPRRLCQHTRSYHFHSPSLRVAGRDTPKSRGRNLHPSRSSPTSATTFSSFTSHDIAQRRNFAIRERLHAEIENTQKINPRFKPSLKIIQGRAAVYSRLTQIANLNCSR
jgi:hypothetical protein